MKQEYKAIGSFGTLGIEIVLSLLFGAGAGYWADGKLGTAPWLFILGFVFGLGAAAKGIQRTMKDMARVTAEEERTNGNPAPRMEKPRRKKAPAPEEPAEPVEHDDEHT